MLGRKTPVSLTGLLRPFLVVWIVVLGGCASGMNEALMERVGQEMEIGEVQRGSARQQPQRVVLEGRIAWLDPIEEFLVLELTQPPFMESRDGPGLFTRSGEHVYVAYRGPLDPGMYCLGRSLTVVGVIRERQPVPGQDAPELEHNPVIEAKHIRLEPDWTLGPTPSFLFSRDPFRRHFGSFHDPFRRPFCD